MVTVSDTSGRTDTALVTVTILEEEVVPVALAPLSTHRQDPSRRCRLRGTISEHGGDNDTNYIFSWKLVSHEIDVGLPSIRATPLGAPDLVLRRHSLNAAESYTFELTAADRTFRGRSAGVARLTVTTALPPWGGYLQASATFGSELTTSFVLAMQGWMTDERLTLEYRFFYLQVSTTGPATDSNVNALVGSTADADAKATAGSANALCAGNGTPLGLWGAVSHTRASFTAGVVHVYGLVRDGAGGGCAAATVTLTVAAAAAGEEAAEAMAATVLGGTGVVGPAEGLGREAAILTVAGRILNAHAASPATIVSRRHLRSTLLELVEALALSANNTGVLHRALDSLTAALHAATALPNELSSSAASTSIIQARRLVEATQTSPDQISHWTATTLLGTLSSAGFASKVFAGRQIVADATSRLLTTLLLPVADDEEPLLLDSDAIHCEARLQHFMRGCTCTAALPPCCVLLHCFTESLLHRGPASLLHSYPATLPLGSPDAYFLSLPCPAVRHIHTWGYFRRLT